MNRLTMGFPGRRTAHGVCLLRGGADQLFAFIVFGSYAIWSAGSGPYRLSLPGTCEEASDAETGMSVEIGLAVAACVAMAKIADADGRSSIVWGIATLAIRGPSFAIPLPFVRKKGDMRNITGGGSGGISTSDSAWIPHFFPEVNHPRKTGLNQACPLSGKAT
jgi:hypothetical protein